MKGILKSIAIAACAFILLNLAALLFFEQEITHRERDKLRAKINAGKPNIVFVGNSMLRANLDAGSFAKAFGKKVLKIDRGGSASASWYLTFKNVIAKAKKKPSYTIFFFRDFYLTMPEYRTVGRYQTYIRDLANTSEPLLERLSYNTDPVNILLARIFPLFRNRAEIRDAADRVIKETMVGGLMGKEAKFTHAAVTSVFQDKNMDKALLTKKQLAAESSEAQQDIVFADVIDNSYLPAIIAEAKKAGIRLIFVRVKRRRDAEGRPQSPALKQYAADLRQYLHKQNIPLIDFSQEPALLLEHYGAGDHLASKTGRPLFTNLLIERLDGIIRKSPQKKSPKPKNPKKPN